jgi:hypothetical protein
VQTDLAVYLNSTKLTLTTDYTVSIATNGTGTVTLNTGTTNVPTTPDASDSVIIVGARALERTTDFVTAGDLRASALNEQLDANVIFDQQLAEENQRTVKAPVFDPATTDGGGTVDMTLPAKDTRKGKYLAFNATTGNPEAGPSVSDVTTVSAAATDIALLADIQDGTTATNAITTVASNNANVTAVGGISANVTTVAGIAANVTTVAGKASLITSDFVSDLNTLATTDTISDLNTLATSDIVSDLNTLATSDIVSDINTLATSDIVSDLNTLATSDFVSDLNTLATSANVTNISTVATNIAGVTSFAERYRVASSDPSSSLDEGDLAFNTTDNNLKFYNGSAWVAISPGIANIVEDTTPQLGGTLDANGNPINVDVIAEKTADAGVTVDGTNIKDNAIKPTNSSGTNAAGTALKVKGGAGTGTGAGGAIEFEVADGGSSGSSVNSHATAVTIADDGKVGIGATPDALLHVQDTAGSTATHSYTKLHIEDADHLALQFSGGTGGEQWIWFADDSTSTPVGGITYYHGGPYMAFRVEGSERMRMTSSGNIQIGSTNSGIAGAAVDVSIGHTGTNGSGGITLFSPTNGTHSLGFADGATGTDRYRGYVEYQHANDRMDFATSSTARMTIDSAGQVMIGKTSASTSTAGVHIAGNETADGSPAYIYSVKSFSGTRNVLLNYHSGTYVGGVNMTNTSTSFPTSSDERLKKNIVDAPSAGDKIDAMQVRSFNWKADDSFQEYGLIAQELQSVYDLPVQHHDTEDTYTVDYSKLVPVLLKEIQDLRKRVATLESN